MKVRKKKPKGHAVAVVGAELPLGEARNTWDPVASPVRVVPVRGAAYLATLEDPAEGERRAAGAFARLRPPPGTAPEIVEDWRSRVAKVARAVKVLPSTQAEEVPAASTRVDAEEKVGTVREEAERLAAETGNERVVLIVKSILDEVGA